MSESLGSDAPAAEPSAPGAGGAATAGRLLRSAREAQGVHIAMLAAAIKVSPRKLDALENDRYDELPDATFTRALAQTVCRALKIDAAPVLARLPQAGPATPLEQVSAGLNAPFRERPGRSEPTGLPPMPLVWGGVALLAAAGVILLWPAGGIGWRTASEPPASTSVIVEAPPAVPMPGSGGMATALPVAGAASGAAATVETVHAAPPMALAASTAGSGDAAAGRGATLTASDASWVEIVDASGQTLLSRVVQPGETVHVDGALPMRVRIGNARSTQLAFRGQAVGLEAFTRDNVARVELK